MKKLFTFLIAILFTLSFAMATLNVDTGSVEMEGQVEDVVEATFEIQNTGTSSITVSESNFIYDESDFEDDDDDVIALAFSDLGSIPAGGSITAKVTATIDSRMDEGLYDGEINLSVGGMSDTFDLEIFVNPEVCEDGIVGDLDIYDFEVRDHTDDFYPGDILEVEAKVSNDGDDDIADIVFEAMLFDLTEGEELTDWVAYPEFDLDEGEEEEDILIELEIPNDVDIDNDIIIFMRVYESGDEDINCDYVKYDDFDIDKRAHDVSIDIEEIIPQTLTCEESFDVRVFVENIGENDEEDVYIKVKDSTGVLSGQTLRFDLDESDDDTKIVTVDIPEDVDSKEYSLEAVIYYDDDDKTKSDFATINIKCETNTAPVADAGSSQTVASGTTVTLDASESSDADDDALTYLWSQESGLAVELQNPTSKIATARLDKEGTYVFKLRVSDGSEESTDTVTINVSSTGFPGTGGAVFEEKSFFDKVFSKNTLTSIFWILGIIVLLLLIVYFVKLIFFSGGVREF